MRFFTYKCEIPFSSKVKSGIVATGLDLIMWYAANLQIFPSHGKNLEVCTKNKIECLEALRWKYDQNTEKYLSLVKSTGKIDLKKKNQKVLFFRLGRNFFWLQFAPWNIYFTLIITLVHNTFVEIKTFQSKITDLTSNHAVTNIVSKYYLLSKHRWFVNISYVWTVIRDGGLLRIVIVGVEASLLGGSGCACSNADSSVCWKQNREK